MLDETESRPAAAMLEGTKLPNGWTVVERVARGACATGSHFSFGYLAEQDNGRRGFLKVMDYSIALRGADPAVELNRQTTAFIFERDLLEKCRQGNLDRVVHAVDHGTLSLPDEPIPVQYLIFELADGGDIRQFLDRLSHLVDWAWMLRAAHHIAVGLRQLHTMSVAHQDLKPSNVLVFQGASSKIADLGCAAQMGYTCPRDGWGVAGDQTYAPPELLFGHVEADWAIRRLGCDVYHLGSMLVFFAMHTAITPLLRAALPPDCRPGRWGGTYLDALPFVEQAFTEILAEFERVVPQDIASELTAIVRELCHPDPRRRGDLSRGREPRRRLALERYVSRLDLLASRYEAKVRRVTDD